MLLPDGYHDLPPGKLAAVVTCLEMCKPPTPREEPSGLNCALFREHKPDLGWYRNFFRRVGEPLLWYSRLSLDDVQLERIIHDPQIEIYVLRSQGENLGILELDFRVGHECEIVSFGIIDTAIGNGFGRWLMNRALEIIWTHEVRRVWLHTCTLDHPRIVPFYIRSGFHPFKRQIEIFDDPRLQGILSLNAAPDVPVI